MIAKYFQYDQEEALLNLLIAVQFIFSHSKDERLLDDILELSGIEIEAPLFLKEIDQQIMYIKSGVDEKKYYKKMKRSPRPLQDHVITWLYYALFWAYDLGKDKQDRIEYPQQLSRVVLHFHYYYLLYKEAEQQTFVDKTRHQGVAFFNNIAQVLTRVFEYMAYMHKEANEVLREVYFPKGVVDLAENFMQLVVNNPTVRSHFFIMKQESDNSNYLLYENRSDGICIGIPPSRRIQPGSNNELERNKNIVHYFSKGLKSYLRLKVVKFKGINRESTKRQKRKKSQYTQREDFEFNMVSLEEKVSEDPTTEEIHESKRGWKKRVRSSLEATSKEEYIPNSYEQFRINTAFSASVTKRALKLMVDYETPSKMHIRGFLQTIVKSKYDDTFSYDDMYISVFLFSVLTGFSYQDIVSAIFGRGDVMRLDLDNGSVDIALDKTLFAKDEHTKYLLNSTKKISYALPSLVVMLVQQIKRVISTNLKDIDIDIIYEILCSPYNTKRYEKYIEGIVSSYKYKLVLNPKQLWRIIESYRKDALKEEMSSLFCTGKYLISDRGKMAYTSMHKKGQIHAIFLSSLYRELGIHDVIAKLLGIDGTAYIPSNSNEGTSKNTP